MDKQTIAINIERFRKRLKLTQKQLAEKSGVSLSSIKLRGKSEPRIGTLKKLSKALSVSVAKLLTPLKELDYIRFRALKRADDTSILINDIALWLDNYNGLLAMMHKKPVIGIKDIASNDPEEAANIVRDKLKIKLNEPIYDILGLLDKLGVKVRMVKIAESGFFGLSVGEKSGGPAIIINSDDPISVERRIYTAAHELGHLILHKNAYIKGRKESSEEELAADIFAAELLLPKQAFKIQWDSSTGSLFYDRIIKIKVIFKVSFLTVLHRVSEYLNRDYQELFLQMSYEHFRRTGNYINRKSEIPPILKVADFRADDDDIAPVCPDLMFDEALPRYTIECLRKNYITLSRASEILDGKSIKDIEELLSVK